MSAKKARVKKSVCRTKAHVQGMTLVELLVAIALFGVLLAVLIPGITGLLGISRASEQQLSSTTVAQRVLEDIKGAWQTTPNMNFSQKTTVQAQFDANCVPGLSLPSGVTAQSQELDARAGTISGKNFVSISSVCPATAPTSRPVMRRVQVTAGTGTEATTLILDMLEPQ